MNFSMRGKLMSRTPRIHRILCMRCGKYQAHFLEPCTCLPLWFCMDQHRVPLCREQQCVYCVGIYVFNNTRPPTRIIQLPGYTIMEDDVYSTRT